MNGSYKESSMSKYPFRTAFPAFAGAEALPSFEQRQSSPLRRKLSQRIRLWAARHVERRALGQIAELNPYLLKDMGISPADALVEAAKFFWQR